MWVLARHIPRAPGQTKLGIKAESSTPAHNLCCDPRSESDNVIFCQSGGNPCVPNDTSGHVERKLWTNCYFRSSTNTQERVPRVGTNPTTLKCTFAWKIFRLWGKCFLAAIVLWSQTSRKKFKAWIWGSHLRDGRSQWLMNCSCR